MHTHKILKNNLRPPKASVTPTFAVIVSSTLVRTEEKQEYMNKTHIFTKYINETLRMNKG